MPINEIYERGRRYEEDDDVWGRVWGRGMKYGVGRGFCGCWWLLVVVGVLMVRVEEIHNLQGTSQTTYFAMSEKFTQTPTR